MAWKSRCGEWSRPPEPSPDASGMLVQLLRAATECEFDLVPEPGQVMQRARTSDAKSSNSPPSSSHFVGLGDFPGLSVVARLVCELAQGGTGGALAKASVSSRWAQD